MCFVVLLLIFLMFRIFPLYHFLPPFQGDCEEDRDDLLFFIRRNLASSSSNGSAVGAGYSAAATAMRNEAFSVEVFRRDSRKLPIGDPVRCSFCFHVNINPHLDAA